METPISQWLRPIKYGQYPGMMTKRQNNFQSHFQSTIKVKSTIKTSSTSYVVLAFTATLYDSHNLEHQKAMLEDIPASEYFARKKQVDNQAEKVKSNKKLKQRAILSAKAIEPALAQQPFTEGKVQPGIQDVESPSQPSANIAKLALENLLNKESLEPKQFTLATQTYINSFFKKTTSERSFEPIVQDNSPSYRLMR